MAWRRVLSTSFHSDCRPSVSTGLKRPQFHRFCSREEPPVRRSTHTTASANRRRLRRPWRQSSGLIPPRDLSEQAAILLRIQPGHEPWRIVSGPRSSGTFLVAQPAIGKLARPMHWAPQWARILTKPLRRLRERPQSRKLSTSLETDLE